MEWFKFRMCWKTPLLKMTDEEIGKVLRCLLAWLSTEEEDETGGRGDILLWQMRDTLSKDLADWQENAERKRRQSLHANAVRWEREHARRISLSPQDPGDPPGSGGSKKQNKNKKQKQNKETEQETESETEKDIRAEKEEEGESSSVLPPAVTELPALTIPLVNGTDFPVYRRDIDEYVSLYPDVDVNQELRNMRGWCLSNPTRRKTKRGVRAFVNTWLKKAQQEAAERNRPPENPFLKYATGEAEIGDDLF